MINVTNLRSGAMFVHQKRPYLVIRYTHTKTGRGGATIRVKSQDIISGVIKDITFNNGDKVEEAPVENKNMQYLYSDNENAVFMDLTTYEQVELPLTNISDEVKFLIENKEFQVTFYEDKPISMVLPASMYYEVVDAPLAVKGNTSTAATKRITLENGMIVDAPQFIKKGNVVKVNTTSGQYVGRGKSQ